MDITEELSVPYEKVVVVLIGNIASGKSRFIKNIIGPFQRNVVSKDSWRYKLGNGEYVFDLECTEGIIKDLVDTEVCAYTASGASFVVDATNMTRRSRAEILVRIPDSYCKIAVVFPDRGREEHVDARFNNNHGSTPKEVWECVYDKLKIVYQEPKLDEGFDIIINYLR